MAGERSAFVEAPDVKDVNPSFNQKRVDDERLPAGRDVDQTNMCSHFALSKDHTRTKSTVAGERSAFIEAPEIEDVNPSFLHKERVNNKSLHDGRDVDHTNTCSNFALSKNTCSNSISSKDDMSELTVDSGINCRKSNVNVLTEVCQMRKKLIPQMGKNSHWQHPAKKTFCVKSSKE